MCVCVCAHPLYVIDLYLCVGMYVPPSYLLICMYAGISICVGCICVLVYLCVCVALTVSVCLCACVKCGGKDSRFEV